MTKITKNMRENDVNLENTDETVIRWMDSTKDKQLSFFPGRIIRFNRKKLYYPVRSLMTKIYYIQRN